MRAFVVSLCLLTNLPIAGHSQDEDFTKVVIEAHHVRGPVYMLSGRGGNIGVCAGPDGAILIDDQFAPLTEKIKEAVASLTTSPIRWLRCKD